VVNRTLRVVTLRVGRQTRYCRVGYPSVTGGVPSHHGWYICITRCVGVWFCWFELLLWRLEAGLVTVCGRFVSCWEIYT
jgi:hypothetical protein